MKFSRPDADVYAPASPAPEPALARTTHLCVAAHQDDIEIMAHAAIVACRGSAERFFTGVVVTNGAGSPRAGRYAQLTDAQLQTVRREEQRCAAALGGYNLQLQLGHPSADVKAPGQAGVAADLRAIFGSCAPQAVFLHNPADKHDTHVAVFLRCLEALRSLPPARRPRRVLGCEVWRGLDWLPDAEKVALDDSREPKLAADLLRVFDSQIAGGKRYDLAALGRRAANATFHTSHQTDAMQAVTWAMDLTPLVADESLAVADFVLGQIERLRADIAARIKQFS
ncbi:MAG TPA: PIG-L family deacetylase [Opitutaceae bacterium]|nr:PIG-L family deacetylase [Opitutaceae bacterium]